MCEVPLCSTCLSRSAFPTLRPGYSPDLLPHTDPRIRHLLCVRRLNLCRLQLCSPSPSRALVLALHPMNVSLRPPEALRLYADDALSSPPPAPPPLPAPGGSYIAFGGTYPVPPVFVAPLAAFGRAQLYDDRCMSDPPAGWAPTPALPTWPTPRGELQRCVLCVLGMAITERGDARVSAVVTHAARRAAAWCTAAHSAAV